MVGREIKEIEELAKDLTLEQIVDYLGISEGAKTDACIMEAYKRGKSSGIKDATELLWKSMKQGNLAAITFYLKTQAKWQENEPEKLNVQQISSQPQFNFIVSNKNADNLTDVTGSTPEINLKVRDISNGN